MTKYPTITQCNSTHGAPMGRAEWGVKRKIQVSTQWQGFYFCPTGFTEEPPEDPEPKSVRVFSILLNSGGYDEGGAYWGFPSDLYCATDGITFRRFTRAKSREEAIGKMEIENRWLRKKCRKDIE